MNHGVFAGAVNVESGSRGRVEAAAGPSSMNRHWWTMNSQLWAQEMYQTSAKAAAACGSAGACGGGACASGCSRVAGCGNSGAGCNLGTSLAGGSSFASSYTGSFTSTP